jgi:hypothetical protein
VPRGGTGQSSFSSGNILYGNGIDGLSSSSALNYDGTTLDVTGDINTSGSYYINGVETITSNSIEFTPTNDTFIDFKIPGGNSDFDGRI